MLKSIAVDFFLLDHRAIESRQDIFLQQLQEIKKTKNFQTILFTSVLKKSFDKQIKSQGVDSVIREPLEKNDLLKAIDLLNPNRFIQSKIKKIASYIGFKPEIKALDLQHRLLLNNIAQEKLKDTLKQKNNLTLLMLEVDQYNELLSTYGEETQSILNSCLEQIVNKYLRPIDTYIPLGAAKGIIILPKTSISVARILAEDIQKEIRLQKIPVFHDIISITASCGIAEQKYIDDLDNSAEKLQHTLNLVIGYTILAKQKGNQIIDGG
jgi:diguanylate cyclase (GGDEF)-like protein